MALTLSELCVHKVAHLAAAEVEETTDLEAVEPLSIINALTYLPNHQAGKVLTLLVQSGHAAASAIQGLVRHDFASLDLSHAARPRSRDQMSNFSRLSLDDGASDVIGSFTFSLPALLEPCLNGGSLRELNLSYSGDWITDTDVRKIAASCAALENLTLRGLDSLRNCTVRRAIRANAKTLRRLDLAQCTSLSDGALRPLGPRSKGHLHCDGDSSGDSSGGFNRSPPVPTLEALDVSQVTLLTARSLMALGSGSSASTLQSLVLDGCLRIDTSGYELDMCCDGIVEDDWTSDESNEEEENPKPKKSSIEDQEHIESCLSLHLSALTALSAKGLSGVTPEHWAEILAGPTVSENENGQLPPLARFKSLKLGECALNPSVLARLLPPQQGSSSLATRADTGSAASVVETNPSMQHYPFRRYLPNCEATLTELDLSWAAESLPGRDALAFACAAGRSLQTLKLRCVNLEEIEVCTSSSIGSGGISTEDEDDEGVSGESRTGDAAGATRTSPLALLGQYCPNLKHLNVSRCGDGIGSTTSLQALALGCQDLIELDLGWTGVEDQGVSVLLQSCKSLARLCLQGSKQLTVSTAEVLGSSHGDQLAWVDLSWVNAMDAQVVETLVERQPHITVVDYYGEYATNKAMVDP